MLVLTLLTTCLLTSFRFQDTPPTGAQVQTDHSNSSATVGRRMNVLFIGDHGLHRPADRLGDVYGPLLRQGFAIDWEDDLAYITAERLKDYDCVVMYANQAQHAKVPVPFFEAITGFVRQGGGLVALHCTSGCFPQSPEWLAFIGARFVSHGAEIFQQQVVAPEHPVMRNWKNFTSWDETYVQEHAPGERTVLTVRAEEPWSWVRGEGTGRIFYTASGHDQRAWRQPGFLDLLVRAMDWTAGPEEAAARRAYQPPAFTYREHEWVPNYEERDPRMPFQNPSTPEQAEAALIVPAGFEAVLFASEPMVVNPIAMTWDEHGRCWVIESPDYPGRKHPEGKGHDRISILEDTDGDGRADKKIVFQDGLNLPTGLARTQRGVIVAQAPHLLLFEDHNEDDVADSRKVLVSGFGRWDTHAGPSNLQWGPDDFLWGAVGYAGFEREDGSRFGSGLWRWNHGMKEPEFMAQFTNNTWGLGFRDDGEIFGSTANGAPSFFVGVPKNAQRRSAPDAPGADPAFDSARLYPALEDLRQGDFFGQYTSAAGHHFATGGAMPPGWDDRVAFVCGPTGHLVGRFQAVPDGSGYRMQNAFNLCVSLDEWFCPVHAEVGPDDAVWIADFAQFIILHNLPGNPDRGVPQVDYDEGNAHKNPLRDREHGRIFRIVRKGWEPKLPDLTDDEGDEDIRLRGRKHFLAMGHPNRFWRGLARRRHAARMYPTGRGAQRSSGDQLRGSLPLYRGTGMAATLLEKGDRTRPFADQKIILARLEGGWWTDQLFVAGGILDSKSLAVRRHALMAAARLPYSDSIGISLSVFARTKDWSDPWITQALRAAVAQHADAFVKAAEPMLPEPNAAPPRNLFANPGFEDADPEDPSQPAHWTVRTYWGQAEHLWVEGAGRNGSRALVIRAEPQLFWQLAHMEDGADTSWCTEVSVEPNTRYRLSGWIRTRDLTHRASTHGALFNIHPKHQVTQSVFDTSDWTQVSLEFETGPTERKLSINCLYGGWGRSTGEAVYDDLELIPLGPAHDLRALVEMAKGFADSTPEESPGAQSPADDAQLLQGGSIEAGRKVFFENSVVACSRCHAWNGKGGTLGPDLTTIGSRLSPAQLLESIEDPNATLAEGWPAKASIMPPLRPFLSDQELRDLIAFLAASKDTRD